MRKTDKSQSQPQFQVSGFTLSVTILGALLLLTWTSWLAPKLGVPYSASWVMTLSVLLVFGILLVVKLAVSVSNLRDILRTWPIAIAPVLGSGTLVISAIRWNGAPIWAMNGDMVWNTLSALFIIKDGGVSYSQHANPAPLTNIIMAFSYGSEPGFLHILQANAAIICILLALTSIVSGSYVFGQSQHLHWAVRALLVFAVAWMPFTGMILDGMFRLGLLNVLTSYLLLWMMWIIYSDERQPWLMRVSFLFFLTSVMLASWAPLAAFPVLLGVLVILQNRKEWRSKLQTGNRGQLIFVAIGGLQFVGYAIFVTLPDLRLAGSHLGADGAYPPWDPAEVMVIVVAMIALVANSLQMPPLHEGGVGRRLPAGAAVILGGAALVFLYLVRQRPEGQGFWGYYPMKFSSLVVMLLVGISVVLIGKYIHEAQKFTRQATIAAFAVPLYLFAVLAPLQWVAGTYAFAPTVALARQAPDAEKMQAITDLVSVENAELDGIEIFSMWHENSDSLMNTFLLQLEADKGTDAVREHAYVLDPQKMRQICDLIGDVEQPVNIFTKVDPTEYLNLLERSCAPGVQVNIFNVLPKE